MNIDQLVVIAELRDKLEIEQISRYFPEIIIEEKYDNNNKKFHYYFRCLTSEDDTDGFDSPVEALAHFAKRLSDQADVELEIDVDCDEANARYREA